MLRLWGDGGEEGEEEEDATQDLDVVEAVFKGRGLKGMRELVLGGVGFLDVVVRVLEGGSDGVKVHAARSRALWADVRCLWEPGLRPCIAAPGVWRISRATPTLRAESSSTPRCWLLLVLLRPCVS